MPAPLPPAGPPPRPRKWRRRLIVATVLLLAFVWFLPPLAARLGLVNVAANAGLAKLKGKVTVGGAGLGWLSPIELTDVTVTDAAGRTMVTVPRVTSSRRLMGYVFSRADLGTFTVENPAVEIVCENGSTNLEDAIAGFLEPAPASPGGQRPAVAVAVTGGTLTVKDGNNVRTLTGLTADVTVPATDAITARGTAASAGGTVAFDVSAGTDISGTLKATAFPLDFAEPFARRFDAAFTVSGKFDADLTGGVTLSATGVGGANLAGKAGVADLFVTATALGGEPLKLARVDFPCKVKSTGTLIKVEQAELTCDLGGMTLAGEIDAGDAPEKILDRPGLTLTADADLAKIAALFPKLLRLREGTAVTEGKVRLELASKPGKAGADWDGSVRTSAVRGTRDGKPLAWEKPLAAEFLGRMGPNRLPVFDKLDVRADFATASARGSAEQFAAAGEVNLDLLAARLAEFADLGGLRLGGTAKLDVAVKTVPAGRSATATVKLANFLIADGPRELREPELVLVVNVDGAFDAGPLRIDSGSVVATAGADTLNVKLLEPIADARGMTSGRASVRVVGDLNRWRQRAGRFVSVPADLQIAGGCDIAAGVTFDADRIRIEKAAGDFTAMKFTGFGLRADEPQVTLYPTDAVVDRKTGVIETGEFQLASQTVGLATKKITVTPVADGVNISSVMLANANLARVQKTLQLQSDPALGDLISGMVSGGTVTLTVTPTAITFDGTLPVTGFAYGSPQKPTWAEPKLALAAAGTYDFAADNLTFTAVKASRPVGLTIEARGGIGKVTTVTDINIDGKLSYDLAQIEPQLKTLLGQSAKVSGKDARDFRLAGPLAGSPGVVLAAAGGVKPGPYDAMTGNAALGWDTLKAYGFDVGKADLRAVLSNGTVKIDPVEAAFGQTGKVRLDPTVKLTATGYDMTLARGTIIDKAKLTPAACADAVGYALPVLAKSAETEGTISFDLDDNLIPLTDPTKAAVKGKLTLHNVQVGAGPFVTELASLLGQTKMKLTLANEQAVPVRVENGRVYHENLKLSANGYGITTSGSVGLDGSLTMTADVPVPESAFGSLLKNYPKAKEAAAKLRVTVPVGGTVSAPRIDHRAFQAATKQMIEGLLKESLRGEAGGLIEKGLGGLLNKPKKP